MTKTKILIFGNGWIGNKIKNSFTKYSNTEVYLTTTDIADSLAVMVTLKEMKPDVVINTAGKTGRPNIDWCETHTAETYRSNIRGPWILGNECKKHGIYLVHLSSGCIFNGPAPRPTGFIETDEPTPLSYYSKTKVEGEQELMESGHDQILIPRIGMPIDGVPSPRNLITKLVGYKQVIDVENSVTIIPSFLVALNILIKNRKTGIYHIVNPQPIRNEEILEIYKKYVNPSHEYELIKEEELMSQGLVTAPRFNCIMDTTKLEEENIGLFDSHFAVEECLKNYAKLV